MEPKADYEQLHVIFTFYPILMSIPFSKYLVFPLPQIRQHLLDQCNQSIITAANGSQKLILYNQYKTECKLEPYLDLVCENKYKIALSRFRLSSHSLMIKIGQYNGTPRKDRLCTFCYMR